VCHARFIFLWGARSSKHIVLVPVLHQVGGGDNFGEVLEMSSRFSMTSVKWLVVIDNVHSLVQSIASIGRQLN